MKTARQLSVAILVFVCLVSLYGSYHMITDPTGSSLGFPSYILNGTFLSSYATTGWILLFTMGLFSMATIFSVVQKSGIYSIMIMLQGLIISGFVIVEMILISESFIIQYVFLIIGMALLGLGFLQNQRKIAVESEKKTNLLPGPKSHHHKHRKHK